MNHQDRDKREKLAVAVGFVFILIVLVITLLRADLFPDKNENNSNNSQKNAVKQDKPKYPTINATELQKKLLLKNSNLALLDIRPFESYAEEHIIDSLQISLDEFPIKEKIDKRTQIIVIGQNTQDESIAKAIEKLKEEGFEDIIALAGGMDMWKQLLGITVTYGNPNSFIDQSKVAYIDPEQLNEALIQAVPVYIIDVRSKEDFDRNHIQGAINIPFDDLEKRRKEITERKAVIVGLNELQEFQASVQLYDMLLISPFVMRTAMPGWQNKGFPLVAS